MEDFQLRAAYTNQKEEVFGDLCQSLGKYGEDAEMRESWNHLKEKVEGKLSTPSQVQVLESHIGQSRPFLAYEFTAQPVPWCGRRQVAEDFD